jgi:hypothetical protein
MQGRDQCFLSWLGDSPRLVDQSAEDAVASDRGIERDHSGGIVGRWVLVEPLVRPVAIEMAQVLVEGGAGVLLVVDQHPVGALGADAADEPFRVAVRPGVRGGTVITSMPSEANTASKVAVNLESRRG